MKDELKRTEAQKNEKIAENALLREQLESAITGLGHQQGGGSGDGQGAKFARENYLLRSEVIGQRGVRVVNGYRIWWIRSCIENNVGCAVKLRVTHRNI